jgi:two-component system sensor histidine kinase ArlS
MTSNYPYATILNGVVTFHDGKLIKIPMEFLREKNKSIVANYYKDILSKNTEELTLGSDPLGFDFVVFQNVCNIGVLINNSSSALVNNNRKKYPNHKFEKTYFIERVKEDKRIQNFEEYIPIEIATQNIHELRNLNGKISASVDEILDYSTDSEWEIKFDSADDNIKKIYVSSRLTKFILDNIKFYMPDYLDNLKPNTERKFSIHKSVNKIAKIFSNDFKKKKINVPLEGNTFRQVQGDKELFEIVLMLLTENAIKYSRDANSIQPNIKIKENGNTVEIAVSSYGSLIPNEDIPKLFTKGYRSSVHKSVKDGTGMGLHNAFKLIKLFNGELSYLKQPASTNDNTTGWNIFLITCRQTSI